uniref:Uncharacterized protein n=1 Tax=Panagrolaimus sp. PS1159 TaxID=55785 RepID=A0AC35FAR0_9BILA
MLNIYRQNLDKNQFEILTTSAKLESLWLHHVTIMEKERKMTWFEIYEKLPFLTDFYYNNVHEITSVETIMKLHTVNRKVKFKKFTLDLTVSSEFTDIIYLWKFMKDNTSTAWTKKRPWTRPYFRFIFQNTNLHANFSLNGQPSFEYVIVLGVTDPNIIPKYDEKEFFENGVIKQTI